MHWAAMTTPSIQYNVYYFILIFLFVSFFIISPWRKQILGYGDLYTGRPFLLVTHRGEYTQTDRVMRLGISSVTSLNRSLVLNQVATQLMALVPDVIYLEKFPKWMWEESNLKMGPETRAGLLRFSFVTSW